MSLSWFLKRNRAVALVMLLFVVGCDANSGGENSLSPSLSPSQMELPTASSASPTAPHPKQTTAELWTRSCALCHVDGNASAPRIGNVEEWRPRLAKGRKQLLKHTLEGFGQMPPLGYCMVCERDDFLALIDFMTTGIALEAVAPESSAPENTTNEEPRS